MLSPQRGEHWTGPNALIVDVVHIGKGKDWIGQKFYEAAMIAKANPLAFEIPCFATLMTLLSRQRYLWLCPSSITVLDFSLMFRYHKTDITLELRGKYGHKASHRHRKGRHAF